MHFVAARAEHVNTSAGSGDGNGCERNMSMAYNSSPHELWSTHLDQSYTKPPSHGLLHKIGDATFRALTYTEAFASFIPVSVRSRTQSGRTGSHWRSSFRLCDNIPISFYPLDPAHVHRQALGHRSEVRSGSRKNNELIESNIFEAYWGSLS